VNDDIRRIAAQVPVAWDELRERRVLGKIEAKLADRRVARRKRPWLLAGGGLLLSAAVALLAFVALRPPAPTDTAETLAVDTVAARPTAPLLAIPDESALTLPDGSNAQMHTGARVDVAVQTDALVRLMQRAGVVRYEVTPNPGRRFVVDAGGVEVRVIGTVFTIALGETDVRVAVERGKVEVAGAESVAVLGAGDELKLDRPTPADEPILLADDHAPPGLEGDIVIELEPEDAQGKAAVRGSKPVKVPTAAELQERADAARLSGELGEAAAALSELVRRYPKDSRAYSGYFTLGKVERARGRHAAAAAAFTACFQRAPSGSLAEDARAEAAVSWQSAGQTERAAAAAQAYLDRYANGAHRARMQRILDKTKSSG
jgi:transmembrane sensor